MTIDKKRLESMEKTSWDELEKIAKNHKDLARLISDYKLISEQKGYTKKFLEGYLAAIIDLSYIKKLKK